MGFQKQKHWTWPVAVAATLEMNCSHLASTGGGQPGTTPHPTRSAPCSLQRSRVLLLPPALLDVHLLDGQCSRGREFLKITIFLFTKSLTWIPSEKRNIPKKIRPLFRTTKVGSMKKHATWELSCIVSETGLVIAWKTC